MANRKKGGGTVEAVWDLCEPIVKGFGLELWDVRYLKEGAQWYLRVYIDRQEGVTIEDCENVSRAIDEPLDRLDPVDQSYCLEVCSPGVERELTRPEHFEAFLGAVLNVRMIRPFPDGRRELTAILHSFENNVLELETQDGEFFHIEKKDTASVRVNEDYIDIDEDDNSETEE